MNYSAIFARDLDNVISIDDKIPWINNPLYANDLKNFKALTLNKTIVMGRKTFESLPRRKLLPSRTNIVITSAPEVIEEVKLQDGLTFNSVAALHKYLQKRPTSEIFVIGGLELYKSMKNLISKVYITIIPARHSFDLKSERCKIFNDFADEIKSDKYVIPFTDGLESKNMKLHAVPIETEDMQYLTLMKRIVASNNFISPERDRTKFGYYALYGETLKFNISGGLIPLTTLRAQPYRWIVEELLWFMKGQTDNNILKEKNITIWDGNTSANFLKKRNLSYEVGIAGPIYGFQWRHWGAAYGTDTNDGGIDQLVNVIKDLSNVETRYSRRHIISGWNVSDLDKMVLPPCHVLYQFSVDNNNAIHTTFYQRSSDVALACSWNAASAATMTHIIAALTGLSAGSVTMFIANAHIYNNHLEAVRTLFDRRAYSFPKLTLTGVKQVVDDIGNLPNTIDNLSYANFKLSDYFSHPEISLSMNP